MDDEILNSLLKRALGYTFKEVQEEFSLNESGEMSLTKRKVHDKYFPPDSSALKTYLELAHPIEIEDMTDEQLASEKRRLLKELEALESEGADTTNQIKGDKDGKNRTTDRK